MPKKKSEPDDCDPEFYAQFGRVLRPHGTVALDIKGDVATLTIPIKDGAKTSEILEVLSVAALYVKEGLS